MLSWRFFGHDWQNGRMFITQWVCGEQGPVLELEIDPKEFYLLPETNTVDGSEIRLYNQLIWSISHYLIKGVLYIQTVVKLRMSSINLISPNFFGMFEFRLSLGYVTSEVLDVIQQWRMVGLANRLFGARSVDGAGLTVWQLNSRLERMLGVRWRGMNEKKLPLGGLGRWWGSFCLLLSAKKYDIMNDSIYTTKLKQSWN